jgi:hypothetical protein
MLARFFEGGALPVHPQADGSYIAKSRLFPLALLSMNTKPRSPLPEAGLPVNRQSRGLSPSCSSQSCAGSQRDFASTRKPGASPLWVPLALAL